MNNYEVSLSSQYWKDLIQHAKTEKGEPPVGEFGKLHAINITHLLNQLASIKSEIEQTQTTTPAQMSLLQQTLHRYANAIRDYQFITELNPLPHNYAKDKRISLQGAFQELANPHQGVKNQPYDTMYRTLEKEAAQNRDGVREILRKALPNRLSWTDAERRLKRADYAEGKAPEFYSPFLDSLARFIVGILGGCSLIVPMIVMALNPSLTKSLVVVSVAVVLFALAVSLVFKPDNSNTITATATYAAVLVVFVGTSTGAGGT